jgi:phenylpyruvate tautomerase PptA (4-oxalocrotonate tautomerase family)
LTKRAALTTRDRHISNKLIKEFTMLAYTKTIYIDKTAVIVAINSIEKDNYQLLLLVPKESIITRASMFKHKIIFNHPVTGDLEEYFPEEDLYKAVYKAVRLIIKRNRKGVK